MDLLPEEVLLRIFELVATDSHRCLKSDFVEGRQDFGSTLLRLALVCRTFHALGRDEFLWRQMILRKSPPPILVCVVPESSMLDVEDSFQDIDSTLAENLAGHAVSSLRLAPRDTDCVCLCPIRENLVQRVPGGPDDDAGSRRLFFLLRRLADRLFDESRMDEVRLLPVFASSTDDRFPQQLLNVCNDDPDDIWSSAPMHNGETDVTFIILEVESSDASLMKRFVHSLAIAFAHDGTCYCPKSWSVSFGYRRRLDDGYANDHGTGSDQVEQVDYEWKSQPLSVASQEQGDGTLWHVNYEAIPCPDLVRIEFLGGSLCSSDNLFYVAVSAIRLIVVSAEV